MSCEKDPAGCLDIPLDDDDDPAAWDAALAFLYPSSPMPRVTWDTALALLTVAHKYDVPSLTGARRGGGGCMSLACRAPCLLSESGTPARGGVALHSTAFVCPAHANTHRRARRGLPDIS
jgi:hypothetical protein